MTFLINLLTLSRIFLAPVLFILITFFNFYISALLLFILCSFTDYLDGYLARKYNAVSSFGEIIDPIADKILVIFMLLAIAYEVSSIYILFCSAIIFTREIWVSALRDFNSSTNNNKATKVTFIAKIKTTIQMFTISLYLLSLSLDYMLMLIISDIFLALSVLITIYTSIEYTRNSFLK